MMGWYNGGLGWGGWVLMTVLMLAFWTVVVFGGLALMRNFRREERQSRRRPDAGQGAEELLSRRFARGEIDEEDYRHRRELLRSGR